MYKLIKPTYDNTIYENESTENAGIDEILQLKFTEDEGVSRIILQFDNIDETAEEYYLKLYTAENHRMPYKYTIEVSPLTQIWDVGLGRSNNTPITTIDSTWVNSTNDDIWTTGSLSGSFMETTYVDGGGSWYNDYTVSQSFSYGDNTDIKLNITSIVDLWNTGSIDNNGLIIKIQDETVDFGEFNFYSLETHTIYQPQIKQAYDDSVFNEGNLTPLLPKPQGYVINIPNLKKQFVKDTDIFLRIQARDNNPIQNYSNENTFLNFKYLPSTTYYSIIDAHTNEVLIDFDTTYTKISCNSEYGNYIKINTNNFNVERWYKIIFMITWYDQDVDIVDNDFIFKIIK